MVPPPKLMVTLVWLHILRWTANDASIHQQIAEEPPQDSVSWSEQESHR